MDLHAARGFTAAASVDGSLKETVRQGRVRRRAAERMVSGGRAQHAEQVSRGVTCPPKTRAQRRRPRRPSVRPPGAPCRRNQWASSAPGVAHGWASCVAGRWSKAWKAFVICTVCGGDAFVVDGYSAHESSTSAGSRGLPTRRSGLILAYLSANGATAAISAASVMLPCCSAHGFVGRCCWCSCSVVADG